MTNTPFSLMEKLAQGQGSEPWQRLTAMYTPLLCNWLQRYQLQAADIDDLIQEVLLYVAEELPKFQHNGRPGAFRCWLRTILAYRLRKFWTARDRHQAAGGSHVLEQIQKLEDPASGISQIWNREHDQQVAHTLLEMVRPRFNDSTWQAFSRTVLEGANIQETAQELGLTPNAVCIAKSRVLRDLRQEARGLID